MTSSGLGECAPAVAAPFVDSSVFALTHDEQSELRIQRAKLTSGAWIPFSFSIGERKAAMRKISAITRQDMGQQITRIDYREELEPLSVILTVEEGPEDARWRVTMKMRADGCIRKLIKDVVILQLASSAHEQDDIHLFGVTGGFMESRGSGNPPSALQPWTRAVRIGEDFDIDSDGSGRSSNSQIPLWVCAGTGGGYWFGPEWSGSWCLRMSRDARQSRIEIGMPTLALTLEEGEQLELPSASFAAYRGDLEQGLNRLRATVLENFLPKHEGRAPSPKVIFQGYAGLPKYQTEQILYDEVGRAAEVGCEAFVLDAGWNHPPTTTEWPEWLGNWEPNAERFPRGFDTFARYVHEKGMKLGVWIEPRAATSSCVYKKAPHLFLSPTDSTICATAKFWSQQARFDGASEEAFLRGSKWLNENKGLLDLSQEGARALLLEQLENLVSLGADWIWFDFNTDPRLSVWEWHEKADRKGVLELEFYKGLYAVLDCFLERHPTIWIESCAAGGRTIDLGMLRRSHSVWVCDTGSDDRVNRDLRGGANRLLPAATIQTGLFLNEEILSTRPSEPVSSFGSHRFLTSFGGAFQFGQGLCFWTADDIEEAKRYVRQYKEHRHYLEKDYFQLLPERTSVPSWNAWQYHDEAEQSGILLLFRAGANDEQSKAIRPKGIENLAELRWIIVLGHATVTIADRELLITLDAPGAALVKYSKH